MASDQEKRRKLIISIHVENPGFSQRKLAKTLGIPKTTVQNVLAKFKDTQSVHRKVGSGRKRGSVKKDVERQVRGLYRTNPNLSLRDIADKVGVSKSTVLRMKKRLNLKSYKVQSVPDRSAEKNKICKIRARKLYEKFLTKFSCTVMDDETYCKADFTQLPGQEYYVSTIRGGAPVKFKVRPKTKFPKKFLVWQAICTCGLKSRAFITQGSINSQVYVTECLKKRLLPFIRQHNGPALFWPDLATCHYSASAFEFYSKNSINIVPREANPPNCPELRPIERYWALIKRKLKKTRKRTSDLKNFKRKYKMAQNAIDESCVKRLMKGLNSKVNKFYKK